MDDFILIYVFWLLGKREKKRRRMNSTCCSACKVMKCDCAPNCIFAPHFPLTNLETFERLHRIFGAGNVFKILANLDPIQRETAVNALCYEAEALERDPIFGCVGIFNHYKNQLQNLDEQINSAKNELAAIIGLDNVPQYSSIPMPADFLTNKFSLHPYIEKMEGLDEVQKKELMQLPPVDAQVIVNEMFRKRGNIKICGGHGDACASTSGGTSATQKTLPFPQNHNQP